MHVLILRLDAPLMSFGAPLVDEHGKIKAYPSLSMITGLLANALGYHHKDFERLENLQQRIRFASRQDRAGQMIQDFQTVDLSKDYMSDTRAWTTRGWLDERAGGPAKKGTHIRLRDYRADSIHTVALTVDPEDESPTIEEIKDALMNPERPLFIGRKSCIPAVPLFRDSMTCSSLIEALEKAPLAKGADRKVYYPAWWPAYEKLTETITDVEFAVTDRRDWANQIHVGERLIAHGQIKVSPMINTDEYV